MLADLDECCRLPLELDLTSQFLAPRWCSTWTHFTDAEPRYVTFFTLTLLMSELLMFGFVETDVLPLGKGEMFLRHMLP
jgi:hypothetical protein